MKTWHVWALAVTIGPGGCGDDAADGDVGGGEVTDDQTPWDLHAERALPAVPAGYGVRARGNVIAIRGDDGLWRSEDGGVTFTRWTRERTKPLPWEPV